MATTFCGLREELNFPDVILKCEDHHNNAYMVIPIVFSPFFSSLLNNYKHPHPMIYVGKLRARRVKRSVGHFGLHLARRGRYLQGTVVSLHT